MGDDPSTDPVGTVRERPCSTCRAGHVELRVMAIKTAAEDFPWRRLDFTISTGDCFPNLGGFTNGEVRQWLVIGAVPGTPAATATGRDAAAVVADFCRERGQYITAINNCHPDNDDDYYRWQGHAEARRQLTERLEAARLRTPAASPTQDGDAHVQ